jgi:hypothetical protein
MCLVLAYLGQWGEEDTDRFKVVSGVNVTNPHSPRWNATMWDRAMTTKPADPREAAIWKAPPKEAISKPLRTR